MKYNLLQKKLNTKRKSVIQYNTNVENTQCLMMKIGPLKGDLYVQIAVPVHGQQSDHAKDANSGNKHSKGKAIQLRSNY